MGVCEVNTCGDGSKNGTETDVDCGGQCPGCAATRACNGPNDCQSRVCTGAVCVAPTCSDGVKNGDEGDVDCGGTCPPCAVGSTCSGDMQCASGTCSGGLCVAATCSDNLHNGAETDVDCGGPICGPCANSKHCLTPADCSSTMCSGNRCIPPTCQNGMKDTGETDTDCGGPCPGCAPNKTCATGSDCSSLVCNAMMKCTAPSCTDLLMNGTETDVDCGGGTCGACATRHKSDAAGDCISRHCGPNQRCLPPTCADGLINGGETDLDCGGPACPGCSIGQLCMVNTDCAQNLCDATKHCAVPPLFGGIPPVTLAGDNTPYDMSTGDLDSDGNIDVFIVNQYSYDVNIYWGNGDGSFDAGPSQQVSGAGGCFGGQGVAMADVTGDGKQDLVVIRACGTSFSNIDGCGVAVIPGAGSRTFLPDIERIETPPNSGGCGTHTVTAKLNADNIPDIIGGHSPWGYNAESSPNYVWLGSMSTTSISPGVPVPAPMGAGGGMFLTTADVDRNGTVDLIAHHYSLSHVFVHKGMGDGTFANPTGFAVAPGLGDVVTADLNADTYPDIIVASSSGQVGVALSTGPAQWLGPASYTVTGAYGVALADIDGDGKLDLVVGGSGLAVLRGNGDGTFRSPEYFFTSLSLGRIEIADFNKDGKPDVAARSGVGAVVLINTSP